MRDAYTQGMSMSVQMASDDYKHSAARHKQLINRAVEVLVDARLAAEPAVSTETRAAKAALALIRVISGQSALQDEQEAVKAVIENAQQVAKLSRRNAMIDDIHKKLASGELSAHVGTLTAWADQGVKMEIVRCTTPMSTSPRNILRSRRPSQQV